MTIEVVWASTAVPQLNAAFGEFVARHIDGCTGFQDFVSFGVIENDLLIACVIYNNYYPKHGVIEFSAASISKRWLTRPVLNEMFGYPFDQLGCQMVAVRVAETNRAMAKICEDFGFNKYVIPRLHGRNEAEIIFTFTDDQWANHVVNRKRRS
jgi:RimJ/RimL family protein N-acetyltransferase